MNENNKLIFELIKNHYGYTDESLSYIENQLENHTSSEFIEKLFFNAQEERIYFPISLEYKEKIDEGWTLFKKLFLDFCSSHEITYSDFVDNKVTIGKNSIKLKKALVSFFIKKKSETIIKGTVNTGANNAFYIDNSISGFNEIIYTNKNGYLKILIFVDVNDGIIFKSADDIHLMNGVKKYTHATNILGALALNNDITVKTSSCNRVLFTKNIDENFVSFYVNKISEGGYNFFRRYKISEEDTVKYFSNKIFLTTTNDDAIIKMFYIDENKFLNSTMITINQSNGEISFGESVVTDLRLDNEIGSFSIITKEKHLEFYFHSSNEGVTKFITENGVNFVKTSQDFSTFTNKDCSITRFSEKYIYSIKAGYITVFLNNIAKNNISEELKKLIENDINKKLEIVGAKSLPKNKDISIVISKNFADWFLCSSAETWSSCLNLESHHSACHWGGLPALLGDKNRVMFYITDGTKKTYKGIVVDKLLTRTWGLLDSKNIFRAIKFYPIEMLDIEDLAAITKLPINYIERDFVSKDPIEPIYYKYNDRFLCSSFIFQDKTQFVGLNDGYHLAFGAQNGYYSIVKDLEKKKESIKPITIFEYTGGLSLLKDRDLKLTNFKKPLSLSEERCCNCGNRIREGASSFNVEEHLYCRACFNEAFYHCSICNNIHSKQEPHVVVDDCGGIVYVCVPCAKNNVVSCNSCGKKVFKKGQAIFYNEHNEKKILCSDCLNKQTEDNVLEHCHQCSTWFHPDVVEANKVIQDNFGSIWCGKCLFEAIDKKQIKFSFYVET